MKDKVEAKLSAAVSAMMPEDMFERICAKIPTAGQERKLTVVTTKAKLSPKKWLGAAVAACVLIAAGAVGIPYYNMSFVADSRVDIDVNPGVEITTNKGDKVLNVVATNADGETILDGMNLKNTELKVAVNAIIGSMVQNGYIESDKNEILVTVQNEDAAKAAQLKNAILSDINASLTTNNVTASIINQTVTDTSDAKEFAKNNGISVGKAHFVMNLAAKDNTLDPVELAKMSLKKIAALVTEKGIYIDDIVERDGDDSVWENIADTIEDFNEGKNEKRKYQDAVAGATTDATAGATTDATAGATTTERGATSPATGTAITEAQAKEIALKHAGFAAADVDFIRAKQDTENRVRVYEIEFYRGNTEYSYDINIATGEIVSYEVDTDD